MNTAVLSGVVVSEIRRQHTPSNRLITKFRIATSNGNYPNGTSRPSDIHNIAIWATADGEVSDLAHWCAKNLERGDRVVIRGKIAYDRWTAKSDGTERFRTEIRAQEVDRLGRPTHMQNTESNLHGGELESTGEEGEGNSRFGRPARGLRRRSHTTIPRAS